MKFIIKSVKLEDTYQTFHFYNEKAKPYQIKLEEVAGYKVATIELETMEDLLKLSQKIKTAIVFNANEFWEGQGLPVVEIYDGYRE